MCQGEENRLFVQLRDHVLELDTSTTTFTKVRTIRVPDSLNIYSLCYVPDPYQLLVVRDDDNISAVSCDDDKGVWRLEQIDEALDPVRLLIYVSSHNAILAAEWSKNRIVVLHPGNGIQVKTISLPDNVHKVGKMCLFNNQIIVAGKKGEVYAISYFSLKWIFMQWDAHW